LFFWSLQTLVFLKIVIISIEKTLKNDKNQSQNTPKMRPKIPLKKGKNPLPLTPFFANLNQQLKTHLS